jgi:hypothetical protein
MTKSVKDLCRFFWYLEEKYHLLDFEVDGVVIWQYLRMEIYYDLAKKTGILEDRKLSQSSKRLLFRNAFNLILNTFRFRPFSIKENNFTAVFTHNRSTLFNGEFVDIYTKFFTDKLANNGLPFKLFEKPFQGKHKRIRTSNTYYLDYILLSSVLNGKVYQIKDKNVFEKIQLIENEIREHFFVELDLKSLFRQNVGRFKRSYKLYLKLFEKIKPKEIYLVVSYAFMGDVIKAAKDLGIPTTEFQHGVIGKYHLGYSYNSPFNHNYLPNRFFSWGRFWEKALKSIHFDVNVENVGFDFFRNKIERIEKKPKDPKSILIISQTALGDRIMAEISKNWNLFGGLKVYYKLHPEEYSLYKSYSAYNSIKMNKEITFLENCDLYEIMTKCNKQIGVFSTALFEGLAFNCKTYLLDLPGVEYMTELLDQNYALFFSKENWLLEAKERLNQEEFF